MLINAKERVTLEHFKQLKQVAEELNVTVSSLRGYVTVLEQEGYSSHIQRDSRNHRLFSEKNIAGLKHMIHLIKLRLIRFKKLLKILCKIQI